MLKKLFQQTPYILLNSRVLIPLTQSSISLTKENCFGFAKKIQKVPQISDSFTSGSLKQISKKQGELVNLDDPILSIETDKIDQDILAPLTGVITKFFVKVDDEVKVGDNLFEIDDEAQSGVVAEEKAQAKPELKEKKQQAKKEQPVVQEQKVEKKVEQKVVQKVEQKVQPKPEPQKKEKQEMKQPKKEEKPVVLKRPEIQIKGLDRSERREKINKIRQTIAKRLKDSQNVSASLTTFQEIDMYNASQMRKEFSESFEKKHGIKLGFMSFFIRASSICLKRFPMVNAVIDGNEIVFRNYIDISIAVSTPKGLIVPVIRNCEHLSFADIEKEVKYFGEKGRQGKIEMDEIKGGTFTISNGGVFGSLFSTPIINPPQSGVLGLHGIKMRPTVIGNEIKARPMMYVALTYDHRLVDGKDAASFLKQVAVLMEDPKRMLLDI